MLGQGTLSVGEHLPVEPRGNADEAREGPGKMALIDKACLCGHIARGNALFQQLSCGGNADIGEVLMGRDAPGIQKAPQQGGLAQVELGAELVEQDVLPEVLLQIAAGPFYFLPARRRAFRGRACVAFMAVNSR